jgi:hypothetical protein
MFPAREYQGDEYATAEFEPGYGIAAVIGGEKHIRQRFLRERMNSASLPILSGLSS